MFRRACLAGDDLTGMCVIGVDVDIGRLSSRTRVAPELSIVHGIWLVVVLAGRLMSMLKLAINLVCDGKFRKV